MEPEQYEKVMAELRAMRGESSNGTRVTLALLDAKLTQVIKEQERQAERQDMLAKCQADEHDRVTRIEGRVGSLAVGQSIFTTIAACIAAAFGASK